MIDDQNSLLFSDSPTVRISGMDFNCQVLLQYFDTPMLEVVQEVTTLNLSRYTTKLPIYHNDGTKLAVAKGSQLYRTADGEKAGVEMRHPPGMTVCEMNGRPIFEMRRTGSAAVSMTAELYTNDGVFLKWSDASVSEMLFGSFIASFPKLGLVVEPADGGGLLIRRLDGLVATIVAGGITGRLGILIGTRTPPGPGAPGHDGAAIHIGEPEPRGRAGHGGNAVTTTNGTIRVGGVVRGGIGGAGVGGGNGGHGIEVPWPNQTT